MPNFAIMDHGHGSGLNMPSVRPIPDACHAQPTRAPLRSLLPRPAGCLISFCFGECHQRAERGRYILYPAYIRIHIPMAAPPYPIPFHAPLANVTAEARVRVCRGQDKLGAVTLGSRVCTHLRRARPEEQRSSEISERKRIAQKGQLCSRVVSRALFLPDFAHNSHSIFAAISHAHRRFLPLDGSRGEEGGRANREQIIARAFPLSIVPYLGLYR